MRFRPVLVGDPGDQIPRAVRAQAACYQAILAGVERREIVAAGLSG